MQSRTIDVPREIPKRSVLQYVHAEAQKLEKRFRCGMEEDDRTSFEQYAEAGSSARTSTSPAPWPDTNASWRSSIPTSAVSR